MFTKENMFYSDYNWMVHADIENPRIISFEDVTILDRTEGFEMLYYIRCLAKSWSWKDDAIRACQKLEKTIRQKVPLNIQTYGEIKTWIQLNFKSFWDTL